MHRIIPYHRDEKGHLLSVNEAVTDYYLKLSDMLEIVIMLLSASPSVSAKEHSKGASIQPRGTLESVLTKYSIIGL